MKLSLIYLGLLEMVHRWRDSLLMAGVIAVSLMGVLLLNAYQRGLEDRFMQGPSSDLIAQEMNSTGDLYASRLPAATEDSLLAHGLTFAVPQIQVAIGTSPENAVLLRGVRLDSYDRVERYKIIAGRHLEPGDPARSAMIGAALAETKKIGPGDTILLRGRPFNVVGVFTVGTYADFEAWVPLEEAQRLIGWGDDVSGFVLPAGEGLEPGDQLPGGISIVARGQTAAVQLEEWQPVFDLLRLVSFVMVIAAAVALANMLWRLAWVRRRQLAIMGSIGYRQRDLAVYLVTQGLTVTLLAYIFGLSAALLFATFSRVQGNGVTVEPVISLSGVILALILAVVIALGSAAIPAWWITRFNLAGLLRAER